MESSVSLSNLPLCDVVMEGGITSGVIYPSAVVRLSEKFRITNIGGTSAGAIAAAATAAAELGRLKYPELNPGYKRLEKLAEELSQKVDSSKKTTRLQNLFQPNSKTRPLYTILISLLNHKTKKRVAGGLVLGVLRAFPFKIFLSIALPTALYIYLAHRDVYSLLLTILVAFFMFIGVAGYSIWRVVKGPVVNNGYGICKGYFKGDDKIYNNIDLNVPLTLWLSRLLNQCAGKASDGVPLTFGELWKGTQDEKSTPPGWLQDAGLKTWKYVNLEMITTNVTHGRPYRFPNDADDEDQELYFDERELEEWFPLNVVQHMVEKSVKTKDGKYLLPAATDLPVVFATRLSLSFPFLLSAVPLYASDDENPKREYRKLERCWFSDGGICSNFPIHLFDSALPLWPTFGIKLENEIVCYRDLKPDLSENPCVYKTDKNRFFLPEMNEDGRGDNWIRFDDKEDGSKKIVGFTLGLLNAARNWRDSMLTRAPGVRDRIVRVYLKDTEGGLNLNMGDNLIKGLSSIGEEAAELLIDRFLPNSTEKMNFNNHRWVRLRNFASIAEKDLSNLQISMLASVTNQELVKWHDLITDLYPKDDDHYPISPEQQEKLKRLLDALIEFSRCSSENPRILSERAPLRIPTVRIVPDI
jgi:predicted acylesterase/phospholipase RssA